MIRHRPRRSKESKRSKADRVKGEKVIWFMEDRRKFSVESKRQKPK